MTFWRGLQAATLVAVLGASGGAVWLGSAPPAQAQNLFAPRLYVNDQAITFYEVEQRAKFLQVLRSPGDPMTEALRVLTEDRLRLAEAKRLGITMGEEQIKAGMEEFASRANLSAEQLLVELQKADIAPQTFRDFVLAGLVWREVVRARFVGMVSVSEADIDKAMQTMTRPRALSVLASELVIPAPPGQEAEALALADELAASIRSEAQFAEAARKYSASPTAAAGGRLEWLPLANMPPAISGQLLTLGKGKPSQPMVVPNAVVLFMLRDVAEDKTAAPISVSVEYAKYFVADDPAAVAHVAANVDRCMDLYGLAKGQPAEALVVETKPMSQIPSDIGLQLAKLDPGEFVTSRTAAGQRMILMLCTRNVEADTPPTRDQLRDQVQNQKLDGLAQGYMAELKANALIREP
ncbi:peptidylprolyl isomerase [Xinfangfangia sp. CPCC 101601]|uniref:Parvulin-like PPIase n=1 Tax=Pseudogemmobacter lacusdianii TaxID=3069608 RepID=A0ABU0VVR4_9RHOB|nr:peptidylprolyl isomerase [Xinfangfangia sp. CPCC 101601]MDQ2065608.1 peptidylprolyl isomerase [Xinfangfangia sp. CPCC 101601]